MLVLKLTINFTRVSVLEPTFLKIILNDSKQYTKSVPG